MNWNSTRKILVFWMLIVLLSIAFYRMTGSRRDDHQAADTDADIAAIKSMAEQLGEAYVARDWDRFTSFFTDDAVWMPRGQPPLIGKRGMVVVDWGRVGSINDPTANL